MTDRQRSETDSDGTLKSSYADVDFRENVLVYFEFFLFQRLMIVLLMQINENKRNVSK